MSGMRDEQLKELLFDWNVPAVNSRKMAEAVFCAGEKPIRCPRRIRALPVLAALALLAVLVGAGQFYHWQRLGTDGSRTEVQVASSCTEPTPKGQELDLTQEPLLPQPVLEDSELLITVNEGFMAFSNKGLGILELEEGELRELADSASVRGFLLPEKLPKGFHTDFGSIQFYLPEAYRDLPAKEWVEAGNGFSYQIFALPEDWKKHVEVIRLVFANDRGETFEVMMTLAMKEDSGVLATGQAYSEKVRTKALGKGLFVEDSISGESGGVLRTLLFSKKIPKVKAIEIFDMGIAERKEKSGSEERENRSAQTYTTLSYQLSSETLSKEALLEIVEGMA